MMKTETMGTVVAGILKLDERIDLPDQSRVRVALEPLEERWTGLRGGVKAWRQLRENEPINSGGRRYTRDELHERH
jgi:hypothetical protein